MSFVKDPDAVLDFKFPWATQGWLGTDTIASHTVTVAQGDITVDTSAVDDAGDVVAWYSGGTDGTTAKVTCHIVTTDGRADDRTMTIRIRER